MTCTEADLRARLGVPPGARRVMVVTESTHWDPNWLLSSSQYFRLLVQHSLDRMLDELLAEPRRVFSLECVFFPDLYWRRRPQHRDVFRELVNQGRIHFTGSGVTTPDTLLPEDETILRDLLLGQEWLRVRGMTVEPRTLYLPDSFGHSPGLPSLLAAAGVDRIAFYRIDGMHFPGGETEPARHFPRPGTSAELLTRQRTADFVWRGPDGSEALAHWVAHGYGHGDMIASRGFARLLRLPTNWPDRRPDRVAARIERYIAQLEPLTRTPYLLLAIGHDFVTPIPRLVDLLDQWNEHHFDRSGVWLVNASLDDYFDLVSEHRDLLPTLEFDPNPCWTGFYASRPDIKAASRLLGRRLVDADNDAVSRTLSGGAVEMNDRTNDGAHLPTSRILSSWWRAACSNHHDFITGTATDRVALGEQSRWLNEALTALTRTPEPTPTVGQVPHNTRNTPEPGGGPESSPKPPCPTWWREGNRVTVETAWGTATFDESLGGALTSLTDTAGTELISSPSLVMHSYVDSGGLWRMGHEFKGGRWTHCGSTSDYPARITVGEEPDRGVIRVMTDATLEDRPVRIRVEFSHTVPGVIVHTSADAPRRRTLTLALRGARRLDGLTMHQPGGLVTRRLSHWYQPTFYPLHSFATATASETGDRSDAMSMATVSPTALHARADGTIEVVVARTAVKEIAYGFLPVLAPAWGRRWGAQRAALAFGWLGGEGPGWLGGEGPGWLDGEAPGLGLWRRLQEAAGQTRPDWVVRVDDPLVEVTAVKLADRGEGVIVRMRNWGGSGRGRSVSLSLRDDLTERIVEAWVCDALERDLGSLIVEAGSVPIVLNRHLMTVRIRTGNRRTENVAEHPRPQADREPDRSDPAPADHGER